MPKKKTEEVVKITDVTEVTEEVVETTTVATVVRGAHTARVYTLEEHGEDFAELAYEYARHQGGEVTVR
jgi:hypothetical protein